MKSLKIFGTVLGLHSVLLFVLLLYPGCKTIETQTPIRDRTFSKEKTKVTPAVDDDLEDTSRLASIPVDDAFNDGLTKSSDQEGRYSPQRPPVLLQMEDPSFTGDLEIPSQQNPIGKESGTTSSVSPEVSEKNPSLEYVAKSGDSLWSLARQFGITTKALAQANGLSHNAGLQIGQSLKIPSSMPISPATEKALDEAVPNTKLSEGLFSYTVLSGDSLSLIAKEQGTTITTIRSLNQLDGDRILVGQTLTLPIPGAVLENTLPEKKANLVNQSNASFYTVSSGDRLSQIAQNHQVTVKDLIEWNQLENPNRIRVGQKLKVSENHLSDQKGATVEPKGETSIKQKNAVPVSEKTTIAEKAGEQPTEATKEAVLKPVGFNELIKVPKKENESDREVKIIKVE